MPIATFKSMREVSSEDSVHVASNLLQQLPGKKWKTKTVGEKSAYVILELEEAQQILGIDIGNEHAAFVEVLVGKAGCAREDFKELLITCSFMTPIESKNSANTNRVRCFAQDALVESTRTEKWHMVKVVCSQPFNKHVQYGLSFLKVHVADSCAAKSAPVTKCLVPEKFLQRKTSSDSNEGSALKAAKPSLGFGKFTLRADSPDSESESAAGLFSRWKMSRNKDSGDTTLTAAAAIREASSPAALRRRSSSATTKPVPVRANAQRVDEDTDDGAEKVQPLDRNRDGLLFKDEDDDTHNERLEKSILADKERLRKEHEQLNKEKAHKPKPASESSHKKTAVVSTPDRSKKETVSNQNTPQVSKTASGIATPEHNKKRQSSPSSRPAKKMKSQDIQYRPFNQLLKGVVLVISGIQNPDRANLRSKALAMGAKYKADWENGCTHLICAFKNTPKYNQVKGKGKIVTQSWIEKCYTMKKYIPWRRFALQTSELNAPESDEEILDETQKPQSNDVKTHDNEKPTTSHTSDKLKKQVDNDHTLAMYDLSGDENSKNQTHEISSGSDTDDEIQRVTSKHLKGNAADSIKHAINIKPSKNTSNTKDIFEVSTEEEDYLQYKCENGTGANKFFKNLKFYICADVSVVDKIKLEKYIKQFGGIVEKKLSNVQYALTNECKSSTLSDEFTGDAVRPLWIFECFDMEAKVPTNRYII